ncbi:hypothetical protein Leryth_024260 [Lithospermum erythrorhizon]|nr:hypothetical protein Leryth_024260 [Lithospermum erythrorhizon]
MEQHMYKNRLQEHTQKSGIALPVYQTIIETNYHPPRFRSIVNVDGLCYESPNSFSNRKESEQHVAKMALDDISRKPKPKPKEEPLPFLPEDTSLSKSIMNEYAVKMNLGRPTYVTKQALGLIPVFISDLVLNGVNYTGQRAKNKKEAEQLAAHAAILSLMDSESKTTISEIIKSKGKLYSLLHGVGVGDNVANSGGLQISLNKRKEDWGPEDVTNINSSNSGGNVVSSALARPFHEFKKPKVDSPDSFTILEFVPCSSSSGKKKNRKKKQTEVEKDTQTTDSVMLLDQVPPCSVAGASVSGDRLNVVVGVEGVSEEVVASGGP